MPGYPTRKLLFGGPETLTKADMVSYGIELDGAGLGQQQALHGRWLDVSKLLLSSIASSKTPAWCAEQLVWSGLDWAGQGLGSAESWIACRLRDGVGLRRRCKNA
jgi:hypothetical protein